SFFISRAQNKKSTSDTSLSSEQFLQKSNNTFFQGTKWYCCDYRKGKYKLSIKGNEIIIILFYNENESIVKGVIKNGKIYSNDRLEKSVKSFAGKVYLLNMTRLHVLTSEGGEYDEYYECKK